jgi:hypothetical protein
VSVVLTRRAVVLAGAAWPLATWAAAPAVPAEVAAELPNARLQGAGRLRYLGLKIYEARLWIGPKPIEKDWSVVPLALEVIYARKLAGEQIAVRSLTEMRRQADLSQETADRWLTGMKQTFPNVAAGDRLTGVSLPGLGARFFFNGQNKGDLRDTEFAKLFFGIWLSDKTSEPKLRQALLGASG